MSYKHFTKDQRNELAILLKRDKYELQEIAVILKKHPSSIGREIKRNFVNGEYDPNKAHHKSYVARKYSKYQGMKVSSHSNLEKYVEEKIKLKWSPESIAGRWNTKDKVLEINGKIVKITHPSIYKYLYKRRSDLCGYLQYKRYRVKKRNCGKKVKRSIIPDLISIHKRPEKINKRQSFGHWEGDTLGRIRADKDVIAGLVERQSRFLLIAKLPGLKYTVDGFKKMLNPYHEAFNTLTLDRGVENIKYAKLEKRTYFCDPYSSWQKGSIENRFGFLRCFIPKKDTLDNHSYEDIKKYANIMNNRPMKCLNWNTPKEVFDKQIKLKRAKLKSNN